MSLPESLVQRARDYEREWALPELSVCDFLADLDDCGWTFTSPVGFPGITP